LLGFLNEAGAIIAASPHDRALAARVGATVDGFIGKLFD
jgi:hypothetical protein